MSGEKPTSDARRERLARALKANIARRKAQAKTRGPAEEPVPPEAGTEDEKSCPN